MRVGLTPPRAPSGWAKMLTRSSSSAHPRSAASAASAAPGGGAGRPAARRSAAPAAPPRPSGGRHAARPRRGVRAGTRSIARTAHRRGARAPARTTNPGRTSRSRWAAASATERRSAGAHQPIEPRPDAVGRSEDLGDRGHRRSSHGRRLATDGPLQLGEGVGVPGQLTVVAHHAVDGSDPAIGHQVVEAEPAAMPVVPSRSSARWMSATGGGAVSSSSRRTPPRITRCWRSGLVRTRSDTLSSSSSRAGSRARDGRRDGSTSRAACRRPSPRSPAAPRSAMPRRSPPAPSPPGGPGSRRGRCRRRAPCRLRRRRRCSSAGGRARPPGRSVGRDLRPADVGERRRQGVDEAARAAGRGGRARPSSSRRRGSGHDGPPWAGSARAPPRGRARWPGICQSRPAPVNWLSAVRGTWTVTPSSGPPGS